LSSVFVDTSALVKRYYPETDSAAFERRILQAERIHISALSITEMASAMMRRVRMKEMTAGDEVLIWSAFSDDLQSELIVVTIADRHHYEKAADIIRRLGDGIPIRALDALQLAVAVSVSADVFLCADKHAAAAAKVLGFRV
jgi:predicted nucleic acid-binding protein